MIGIINSKLVCIINKRTAYSYLPKLIVGEKYTIKSIIIIRNIIHYELNEHIGFYYPYDHFKTEKEIRKQKINKISKYDK